MNAWHTAEQQAQINYGRTQMAFDESEVSNRPLGYVQSHHKPRQFGGNGGFENRNFENRNFENRNFENRNFENRNFENRRPNAFQSNGEHRERERGHMAFLKALQRSSAKIRIVDILGAEVIGFLKDCDEMTISLRVPCEKDSEVYQNRVFIKQNIIEFAPVIEGVTFS